MIDATTPPNRADRPSRRRFIRTVAGSAAGLIAAPAIVRGRNLNEKLDIAVIAAGGRGGHNLQQVSSENIVALCDVYEPAVARAARLHPHAKRFSDFRRLYDEAGGFDAVVVSTPEHTHAAAALPALALGKHVYLEKPLSYNVHEARVLREAAAKAGVATQMGTQIHASENYRRVVELIRSGVIGPVREAHVWVSRAWGRQSPEDAEKNRDIVSVLERPSDSSPIPEGLNWDLWVGPAPARPFHEVYWPGPKWYRWWDFGNGTMSDLGSHWNDLPFWALDLKAPLTIEAFGPPPHPEIAPASMKAVYEYGPRGDQPPVTLSWYQGTARPDLWDEGKIPQWENGHLFVGEKGMLLSDYGKHVLLPEEEFEGVTGPEPFLTRPSSHHAEWIDACKTGSPTGSNFEYAGWLTEANHLGNVAYRVGRKIEWDAEGMRVTNAPEAEPFIRREYRDGWSLG
ncbi:Gfo/Idh/MocA family protein [Tautonia plasticadhaerens]|uniref:Inositol 2-dehydrogenase n=1 Tax=Tautonia plasticadhaerens TaxID=2527974 RepID=A0A518GV54_9BACT|nr:Gfo/Idh/MocA family oxidoreductase [Tautonia plasticadhaerens]QDV32470.1 Inositol 2-dehydrogenase [Tautonia plasticadhaerens]